MNWDWGIDGNEMKQLFCIWLPVVLVCCACSDPGANCLKGVGQQMRVEIPVPSFTDITVFEDIQLVIKQGDEQSVVVEAGSNLVSGVSASVSSGTLVLRTNASCQLFREYAPIIVHITTPNLHNLRSSTSWPIQSDGVLAFEQLNLISESFTNPDTQTTDGTFDLELKSEVIRLVSNGLAQFQLRGETAELAVNLAAGDSRVAAAGLRANIVRIDHRGSNDIEVFPLVKISGRIRGYGDVICYNRPNEIDISEEFRGILRFAVGN